MSTELTTMNQQAVAIQTHHGFSRDQVELLKNTVCKGATDDELSLFKMVCQKTGLDPFVKQIHAVKRKAKDEDSGKYTEVMSFQVGIDGFRLIAERTGKYEGQTAPQWCGDDGIWKDVWTANVVPAAARVGTYRTGFREPVWGVALYFEYVQKKFNGDPIKMWSNMACNQLAKCAEAQSLRKAFPQELGHIYEPTEMIQAEVAENGKPVIVAAPDKTWPSIGAMVTEFEKEKNRIGPERYYQILQAEGFEEARDIAAKKDKPAAQRIYGMLTLLQGEVIDA